MQLCLKVLYVCAGSGPRDHGCMGDDEDCGRGSGDAEINEVMRVYVF